MNYSYNYLWIKPNQCDLQYPFKSQVCLHFTSLWSELFCCVSKDCRQEQQELTKELTLRSWGWSRRGRRSWWAHKAERGVKTTSSGLSKRRRIWPHLILKPTRMFCLPRGHFRACFVFQEGTLARVFQQLGHRLVHITASNDTAVG